MTKRLLALALLFLVWSQAAADPKVLITFDSPDGHTAQVAEWIAQGVKEFPGADLRLKVVTETTHEDLVWADAIIIGSPVYNAGLTPHAGTFLAEWPFKGSPLKNRVGAAFTSCQGTTAGAENVLFQLLKTMLMFRMVVVGGEDWRTGFGVAYVRDNANERSLGFLKRQCYDLGQRVCRTAEATAALRASE